MIMCVYDINNNDNILLLLLILMIMCNDIINV